jgi:adenylate cyclase class 2
VDTTRYKVRIETETIVAEGPALAEIFIQLGYVPVFVYEKFRSEWSQPLSTKVTAHLVIDETPIGTFAELEGPTAWIDDTLAKLGVDPTVCITDSYGKLFLDWKQRTGSSAEHLTFGEIAAPALASH